MTVGVALGGCGDWAVVGVDSGPWSLWVVSRGGCGECAVVGVGSGPWWVW